MSVIKQPALSAYFYKIAINI